jgi:hypothetical protein
MSKGQLNAPDPFLNGLLRACDVLTKQISLHSSWNCKMNCIDALMRLQEEYFCMSEERQNQEVERTL